MITGTVKGKLLAFAIFSLGIATGSVGSYIYETRVRTAAPDVVESGRRPTNPPRAVTTFQEYLGLSPEQKIQVDEILNETRHKYGELQARTRPESAAIREESTRKISALLTEEQKKKYDDWRKKQQRFRGQPPNGGNKPPSPGSGAR